MTPSLVTVGDPNDFSSTTFRPLGPSVTYPVQILGTKPGTGHDALDVHGLVKLNNAVLQPSLGTFKSAVGTQYVIISNDGTDFVSGTFAGLPEGATFQVGLLQFQITYHGGKGNDVVLIHKNTFSAFAGRTITSPIDEGGERPQLAAATGDHRETVSGYRARVEQRRRRPASQLVGGGEHRIRHRARVVIGDDPGEPLGGGRVAAAQGRHLRQLGLARADHEGAGVEVGLEHRHRARVGRGGALIVG